MLYMYVKILMLKLVSNHSIFYWICRTLSSIEYKENKINSVSATFYSSTIIWIKIYVILCKKLVGQLKQLR